MVSKFEILEPAIDPNNRITFLLDWELTMKCNLDCSYCSTGLYGGHDNSRRHPDFSDCVKTIDFMFEYVDLYMQQKIDGIKYVVLNVYGGESLHHPDIVEILKRCREVYEKNYCTRWHLTITTTTNAIISVKKLQNVISYIDEFTTSYHTENTEKQKEQFKKNLLTIKQSGKRLKCVILMHPEDHLFDDAKEFGDWCNQNQIKILPRQLDHGVSDDRFNYLGKQVFWFNDFYQRKKFQSDKIVAIKTVEDKFDLSDSGRACCGGRQVCLDKNYKQRDFYIENKFTDWYCSVNEFFLYIKQVNGEIFVNKDCKMNFLGTVGPIGYLDQAGDLLEWTRNNIKNNTMPIIQCKKNRCLCGLCAPKARHETDFNHIMRKYKK